MGGGSNRPAQGNRVDNGNGSACLRPIPMSEAMDRSKASDRSGKGLYGLLYQPNPCLGPCVVRLTVGWGSRRWGSAWRDSGPSALETN